MASSPSRFLKLVTVKPHYLSQTLRGFSSTRDPSTGFNPNFNSNHQENDGREFQNPPPHPIPNRPLRGDRGDKLFHPPHSPTRPRNVKQQSDDAFLEKFKLRLDRNNDNEIPLPNNSPSSDAVPTSKQKEEEENKNMDSPPPDANDIFKKMKETGLIPNAVAMLDGLCKDGLVQEAMKLFGLMREKGTIPEVVVYTAVIDGYCKAHKLDDAKRIFRKMIDNGITPNAFSYTVLIQGLYKCNFLDDAIDFSFQMLEAGHSPNVTTFVGLVDGLCREKGVEQAQTVIGALRQKGFFVNDKAIREFLEKNVPLSSSVWEAIFGKKPSLKPF